MLVQNRNLLTLNSPLTYQTYGEVAGTGVIRWKNPAGFGANYAVQIGQTGIDQSEIVLLSSSTPAGTAGTLSGGNTLYPHPADTPLFGIKYNQVVFEVSTTGTVGTALPITGGTVTIQSDNSYTVFDHTAGSSSYAYKTYYRNSATNETTTESDWITFAGFSFYSLAKIRERIRNRLYNSDYIPDDLVINDWVNEWLQMMNNAQVDVNEDYGLGTTQVAYPINVELGTITDTDFRGGITRAWYIDGSGTYQATKMDSNSYSPTRTFTNTYPFYYMQGDTVLGRKPTDSAGTFLLEYPKSFPVLVNDADELPVPMHSFTKAFVDYGVSMALHKDNKHQEAAPFESGAISQLNDFKTKLTPRNRSGATMIDIVESGADNDGGWF